MNAKTVAFVLILSICPETVMAGDSDLQKDLNTRVQAIFAAKCSECHGANVQRPKGGVSLHDLEKIAANIDIVAPSKPDESALWEVIQNDEMPPTYARAGPLNEQEKEAIRGWITSLSPGSTPPTAPGTHARAPAPVPPPAPKSILGWLGRFHILVIHFPIALLAAAALAEALAA